MGPIGSLKITSDVVKWGDTPSYMRKVIDNLIDLKESQASGVVKVRHGVFPKLDHLKEQMLHLDVFLSTVAQEEKAAYPMAPPFACTFFPQIGFLISITELHFKSHFGASATFESSGDNTFGMEIEFKFENEGV